MAESDHLKPDEPLEDAITPIPREEAPGKRFFSQEKLVRKKQTAMFMLFGGLGCLILIVLAFAIVLVMLYVISQNLQA